MKNLSVKDKVLCRRNLRTLVSEVFLLLASALVFAVSHPGFLFANGMGFLAFFAIVPVFAVIRNTRWSLVAPYGLLYGLVFYCVYNFWLKSFHPYAIVLVAVIKAVEMMLLFLALKAADRLFSRRWSYIVQTVVFVAYYYLSQSWFAGYPYGNIAYAVYNYSVLIQICDLTGIWGLDFLMILPQAYAGAWLCDRYSRTREQSAPALGDDLLANIVPLGIWALLVVFQIVYGICSLSYWRNAEPDSTCSIAVVQHNHDSWKGGYDTYRENFITLKKYSLEAAQEDPDLIVWSESAFVPSVQWYQDYPYEGDDEGSTFDYLRKIQVLVDDFVEFTEDLGIPLLTGNPTSILADESQPPYNEEGEWNRKQYNTVILFDEGEVKQTYAKQHLVPFTEHFPYEKELPWLYNLLLANDYNWWEQGDEATVFETSTGVRFSTPICFEDVFGYLCADFVNNGADLLVNVSNDSWSKCEAAQVQHLAMAVFRSVENRRSTVRGTNSGVTCMITPDGTVSGELEQFTKDWAIYDVPVYTSDTYGNTLYTRTGDVPVQVLCWVAGALLALGAAGAAVRALRRRRNGTV